MLRGGNAQLLITQVQEIAYSAIQDAFIAHGLGVMDEVSMLNEFFPNGTCDVTARMRKGIGTKVLMAIMQDARAAWARAIYLGSMSETMIPFAQKNGFSQIFPDKPNRFYLRML